MTSEVTQADRDFAILACRLTGWEGVAQRLERGWTPDRDTNEGKLLEAAAHHRFTAYDDMQVEILRLREDVARLEMERTLSGEGDDPHRILKNALFALGKLKAPAMIYGGVLTEGGKHAWLEYSLREQGDYSVFSGEGRSGAGALSGEVDVERVAIAIRDVKQGLGFDYMDFCRDAARAAIAALNARQSSEGEREALREALAEAYRKGATDVHNYWVNNPGEPPRGDPEFGESASDYAAAALDIFDSAAALRATDDAGGA